MEKWQPSKTPTKQASGWNHAEHKHEQEQYELPFDLPNELSPTPDEPGDKRGRSDQPASQFGGRMWRTARGKVSPVHCPPRRELIPAAPRVERATANALRRIAIPALNPEPDQEAPAMRARKGRNRAPRQ